MSILEAIVLGLVQGLTEFIPISSTGHLKLVPELLGWGDPGAAISAVIQFGTILAVIIYFFRDIIRLTVGFFRGLFTRRIFADDDSREAWYVIFASCGKRRPRGPGAGPRRGCTSKAGVTPCSIRSIIGPVCSRPGFAMGSSP